MSLYTLGISLQMTKICSKLLILYDYNYCYNTHKSNI